MAKNKNSRTNGIANPTPAAKVAAATPKSTPVVEPTNSTQSYTKWFMILLAVITIAINLPTINYEYTLDDPFFTTDNPNVGKGLSAIKEFFTHAAYYGVFQNHDASYRPLMLTSFALEKDLFGFNPTTGHLINLLLFALEIVVLFQVLKLMFKQYSELLPFFMALLFALHPIHTEVVASIKSRDELMGFLFSLLALQQSLRYADNSKPLHLAASGGWFFCALMSKETPIAMTLISPLTIYIFKPELELKRVIRSVVPYAAVAVVYLAMRSMFIESDGEKVVILVNNNALMAATNYGEKLATLLYIQLKYILLLFVPHPLSYDYSYSQIPIISFSNPKALAALLTVVGLFGYAVMRLKKRDVLAWCILFYGMSVIITSNLLVDIGATAAERFIFTGSLGFCVAIVWLVAKVLKVNVTTANLNNAKPMMALLGVVALLYAGKTYARNEAWRNNLALYETGLETAPNSWRAQYLLAVEYTKRMQTENDQNTKLDYYRKAVTGFNNSLNILPNNSDVYLLRGYADEFAGQLDSAVYAYKRTLQLDKNNKQAQVNLGGILMRTGRLDEAIEILTKVVAVDSLNTHALTNLGACYGNKGMFKESEVYYLKAVRLEPEQPANVFMSMSNIYKYMGDSANAQKYRAKMMQAKPQ